jgi:hypothetical protein
MKLKEKVILKMTSIKKLKNKLKKRKKNKKKKK